MWEKPRYPGKTDTIATILDGLESADLETYKKAVMFILLKETDLIDPIDEQLQTLSKDEMDHMIIYLSELGIKINL